MSETHKNQDELLALRSIVEASPASLAFIDREYRLVAANRRRLSELGLKAGQGIGTSLSSLMSSELFERRAPHFEACLGGASQRFMELSPDGKVVDEVNLQPVRGDGGEVCGIVESRLHRETKESLERRLDEREHALVEAENELRRLSTTDSLSGSLNRGAILAALEEEIRRALRYDRPLSLVLFDLDHFKLVNDIHGRAAGDEAIRRFSAICRASFRNTDYVGRYGGEEFLAVLPEVESRGAIEAAERVRTSLQSERFRSVAVQAPWGDGSGQGKENPAHSLGGDEFTVTASAGVAGWEKGVDSDRLLASVDAALYRAKEHGRNRVEPGLRH